MAIERMINGTYVVKTQAQAIEALKMMETLKEEILEIRKDTGMEELEMDSTELKKAVTRWCLEKGKDRLDFDEGKHATLVRAMYGGRWIGTKDDLDGSEPAYAVTLHSILRKKFKSQEKFKQVWRRVTKRVVDPEAIEELVGEGVLTVKEIAMAYVEKEKAPFLRVFYDA